MKNILKLKLTSLVANNRWNIIMLISMVMIFFQSEVKAVSKNIARHETSSYQTLHKVIDDIRYCDKSVHYAYDEKSGQINPPELRKIKGIRLRKLHKEHVEFMVDEMYEGLHVSALLVGRSEAPYVWPIHAVAFDGSLKNIRRRIELSWGIRFKEMLRPGPDVIYDGKYAQAEMEVDGYRRFLTIEKMPKEVYPNINQPVIGCNRNED